MKNSNLIYKSLFLVVPVLAALALMLSKAEPELNLGSPDHDRADVGALRAEGVTFLRHILPMIEEKCFRCHSYRVEKPKGKLRLDSPEHIMAGAGDRVVLVPGKPDSSALYELCSLDSEDEDVMPPAGKGAVMTARQLARLRIWIEDGADFEDWAGAAASKSVMAAMAGQVESKKRNRRRRSSAGPLDVSNYGKAEGNPGLDLTPRKVTALGLSRADVIKHAGAIDGILARRRTAHGAAALPVVNDEVFVRRAYLEAVGRVPSLSERNSYLNRTQEDRRLALVDELITSEGYTQGWYHFYANLLRGTSSGAGGGGKSRHQVGIYYTQWIKQAVRDNHPFDSMVYDLVTAIGMPYQNGAVGFSFKESGMKPDHMANIIQTFMGMQVQCAQCHDHPFDRWNQYQFWEMTAFLGDLRGKGFSDTRFFKTRMEKAGFSEEQMKEAGVFKQANSIRLSWSHLFGVWEPSFGGKTVLPDDYGYADAKPGQQVLPHIMFGDGPKAEPGESRRRAFGKWLISEKNPWFAKNISNRLWKRVMGVGLIDPVDSIKYDSEAAIPAVMDYLTELMVEVDYNSRDFLRVLFATEMFQRAVITEDLPEDYRNYHYEGRPLQRMRAEQIWDSIVTMAIEDPDDRKGYAEDFLKPEVRQMKEDLWHMSGEELMTKLVPTMAAIKKAAEPRLRGRRNKKPKSIVPYQGFEYWGYSGFTDKRWSHVDRAVVRAGELESPAGAGHFVRQFGQSDRKGIYQGRESGAITQAMALLNGRTHELMFGEGSAVWAEIDKARSPGERSKVLFNAVLGRDPTPDDLAIVGKARATYPEKWERMTMWALMNSPEFLFKQ